MRVLQKPGSIVGFLFTILLGKLALKLMAERTRVPAPSDGAEIVRFAIHLGMDLRDDVHLLWIAEEALRAPLPEHWEATVDAYGRPQYRNKINRSITLEHPMDEYYRYLYLKKKLESDASFISSMTADSKLAQQRVHLLHQACNLAIKANRDPNIRLL